MTHSDSWAAATWEGARRERIRRALRLSVRERLQALEALTATSERLQAIRAEGRSSGSDKEPKMVRPR